MRNVAGLAADAIREAFPATAEQVIVEKAVKGAAVRDQPGQLLIAGYADRSIRLGIGINHQDSRSLGRERFRQCNDGGGLTNAAFHVCYRNESSSQGLHSPRQSVAVSVTLASRPRPPSSR